MNSREARITPKVMAMTMSKMTVSDRQTSSTSTSDLGARRTRSTTLCASLMFQATSSSRAAMAESGSQESKGASTSRARITSTEWTTAETGDVAPARTLAAERAMAAVAVMPPKNGAIIFPSPWPTSSLLALCLVPVMPSSTTAQSSDSIAPNIAIEKAAGSRARRESQLKVKLEPGRSHGSTSWGRSCGIPLPWEPSANT